MSKILKVNEILRRLPHRFPFMLLDRVVDYEAGQRLSAIKNVTFNEPFFQGHFPGNPVMPGVLIIEAMAQAGCVLAFLSMDEKGEPSEDALHLFAGIDNARFRRLVTPGDQLRIEIVITKAKRDFLKVKGVATVDGEEACSAEIMSIRTVVQKQ